MKKRLKFSNNDQNHSGFVNTGILSSCDESRALQSIHLSGRWCYEVFFGYLTVSKMEKV